MSDTAARARLDRYKLSLLDPANRLLDLADHGIPIPIDPIRVAFALAGGAAFAFEAGSDPAFEAGRLRIPLPTTELDRRLAELRRDARTGALEGEHVLWLALGLLTWCDGDGMRRVAPLALWPVALEMDGAAPRLVAAHDLQPRLNDMLVEGLRREHELALEVVEPVDFAALFDTITTLAIAREGWRVDRVARLGAFSFAGFDLWRDLETRGDAVLAPCPAAWLAGALAAPATLPTSTEILAPLDADASQLAAIGAAGAGSSFVLHGPPGTGKSQTIANLAVHCASQGKSVLVVSDRASALDVIQSRLSAIGFSELCLPLYASHAGRGRVLGALARVLDRAFRPGAVTTTADARLAELRAELDGYVSALHKVRPLGMSVHEVLGRLVELRTTPRAALAERDAPALDRATFDRRLHAVETLAQAALPIEPVATHPWRMSALEAWHPESTERATRALNDVGSTVETLGSAIDDVGALVPGIVTRKPDQLRAFGALAELAGASPRPGAELLSNMRGARNDEIGERIALIRARGGGTLEVPRDPATFLAIAARHRALVLEVDDVFTDTVANLDASEVWSQLKRWTASMAALRYVALRNARAGVRAAAQPGRLATDEAMITALEAVIAERACRAALVGAAEPALRWFGDLGGDALTLDLAKIEDAVAWGIELRRAFDQLTITGGEASRQTAWRALVAQVSASPAPGERPGVELAPFARVAAAVARWEPALAELGIATGISKEMLGLGADHLASLRDQVEGLRHAIGSFEEWTTFHLARRAARIAGIVPAIAAIERGDLGANELSSAWQRANLLVWVELEIAETPALARFHGPTHHAHVAAFSDLDRGSLALTRARAVARIAERVPKTKNADPEIATLQAELAQPHGRPLRAVLAELPTLLPRLAPCVLATPHSVAQHLDPALPPFDLVVFDEASRLPAARAFAALSRAKSVIVVGDAQQPAPSDGSDGLLDLALATKLPQLSLSAHYRSRHEDLFAFSASRYYGDRIELLPTASASPDLGIGWRRVDGTPDPAGANRSEAEAIVADVRARFADPAQRTRSFAIATFSQAQQDLVEDILDAACVADPGFATSLANAAEPLLVGTPDRLQGEERDVVFVSIADSADALGALAHPGGERWLNVAITRAREQLLIVSSFSPEEVTGEARSARELAALLGLARAGGGAAKPTDGALPATAITAAIARALAERGWPVKHRVGCGAYQIDLAVVDPSEPERYVLAIEHDGPAYASSSAARTRDRLRAQQLAQLGWRLHRVWALDWWADPEREIQRAHGAIVAAVAASRQRRASASAPIAKPVRARASKAPPIAAGSAPSVLIPPKPSLDDTAKLAALELDQLRGASARIDDVSGKREETVPTLAPVRRAEATGSAPVLAAGSGPTDVIAALPVDLTSAPIRIGRGSIAIGPYTAAAVPAGRRAPDDMFAPRYLGELGKCVEQVLAAEAPIHIDLLARRCAAYFGIGRVTQRVTEQIRQALEGRGKLGPEQNIVWRNDQDPSGVPPVRVAGQSASARREIAEVPLSEVAAAARIVVERANGLAAADLVRDCARLLGFARITDQVSERVSLGVRLAAARQLISIDAGKAHLLLDG